MGIFTAVKKKKKTVPTHYIVVGTYVSCCSTIIYKEKGSSNFKRKVPAHLHCLLKPLALQSTETICSRGADSDIKENSSWENRSPQKSQERKDNEGKSRGI